MAKTLKSILETYAPRSDDEKRFIDKHVVVKHADRNGNGDEVFKAKRIKIVKRAPEHGHEVGKDHEVYEEAPATPEDTFLESEQLDEAPAMPKGAKHTGDYTGNLAFYRHTKDDAAYAAAVAHLKDLRSHKRRGIPHPTLGRIPKGADIAGAENDAGKYDYVYDKTKKLNEETINEVSKSLLQRYLARGDRSYDKLNDQAYDAWKTADIHLNKRPAEYRKAAQAAIKIGAKADNRAKNLNKAEARLKEETVVEGHSAAASRAAKIIKQARAVKLGYENQKSGKWSSQSYKLPDGRWASKDVKEENLDEARPDFHYQEWPGQKKKKAFNLSRYLENSEKRQAAAKKKEAK